MKKISLAVLFLIFSVKLFSVQFPDALCGIWEGKDRYVFFENNDDAEEKETEGNQLVVLLKEYYGWYYDRAAEPEIFGREEERIRNSGTTRKAEQIKISVINQYENSNLFLLDIGYSKHEKSYVPVALMDNKMFLNFYERIPFENPPEYNDEQKLLHKYDGFYRGNAVSKGILIADQPVPENIACFIIYGNHIYNVRYWLTDMDYAEENVDFTYKKQSFEVPKHVISSGNVYSCVSGRSKKVRNTMPPEELNIDNMKFSPDLSFFVLDEAPYLNKLLDKQDFNDLMEIVLKANSRRKPEPSPIFPPNNVDWHWDLIDELEKNNSLIQPVRERQKKFGPRAKEFNK